MEFSLGQNSYGFAVEAIEAIPEIDGVAYRMRHVTSGTRLLYLANDDANKAFSISFKTPPANNTGVFHILEHSVLCGSQKFPVKEPFVNLLKTSMQTFLNAMTFPDKTMYPVASTNMQDLMNLTDVYLDAVLHPAIFEKSAIFKQEGWHYELSDQGELCYNGVVYNEMKGALSSPDAVLSNAITAALFPNTAYRFESGGDPASIPDLSYENFLDTYQRHYRLDNSYIVLYGDLDAARMLAFLNEEYLSPVAAEQELVLVGDPNPLVSQTPCIAEGIVHKMETAPENAMCGLGFVVGDATQRRRLIATDILVDALFGSNEAPLKRAILNANIADDVNACLVDAMLQPFVLIQTRKAKPHTLKTLATVIHENSKRLVHEGIDRDILRGALASAEFAMREHDFGYADGVVLAMSALSGWLYDDEAATSYLHYEEDFVALRKALDGNYFESLLHDVFLDNDHYASVELRPIASDTNSREAKRLIDIAQELSDQDRTRITHETAELRRIQETPDTPEALATLPRLSRSDIGEPPTEAPYSVVDAAGLPCILHTIKTHGIAYAYRYYDISDIAIDDLPYVELLAMVLGKLGTTHHSAAELDTCVQNELGSLSFFLEIHENKADTTVCIPRFVVGASALSERITSLSTIACEVIHETDFSDIARIADVLLQKRAAIEQLFANAGHSAALTRAFAHVTPVGAMRDLIGGVGFYRFVKSVLSDFEKQSETLTERLTELAQRIFTLDRCIISFAGSAADFESFTEVDRAAFPRQANNEYIQNLTVDTLYVPRYRTLPCRTLSGSCEAFIVPTDVVYAARAANLYDTTIPYTGVWQIAARSLSFDFLWNEVRVKGGAYGVGFQASRTGALRFYSYRDPHLDETLARYRAAEEWIATFNPSPDELDGYVVSSVATLDAPHKPRELMRRQDIDLLSGYTPQDRIRTRHEMLTADVPSVRSLAPAIAHTAIDGAVCVFGNAEIIANATEKIEICDLLAEPIQSLDEIFKEYCTQ